MVNDSVALSRHPVFWFDDGDLILQAQGCSFKIYKSVISQHSRLPAISNSSANTAISLGRNVRSEDVATLLDYLLLNKTMDFSTPVCRIASLIRATSVGQLDMPKVHDACVTHFIQLFPDIPTPSFHLLGDDLIEALIIALEFNILVAQKRLFYSYITSSDLDLDGPTVTHTDNSSSTDEGQICGDRVPDGPLVTTRTPSIRGLSPAQMKHCHGLMAKMVDHFTPLLFTPATTPHMACTDVFADTWMSIVIQPAIEDDGVCKPLETLERIRGVDWSAHGLCADCVREKKDEWYEEQQLIWKLMDNWLAVGALTS